MLSLVGRRVTNLPQAMPKCMFRRPGVIVIGDTESETYSLSPEY
jgi:hypothetical protein